MEVFTSIEELGRSTDRPIYLALGMFDGVHRGHLAVLKKAQEIANEKEGVAVAFTFPQHPASFLRPDQTPRLIMNKEEKAMRLLERGMSGVVLRTFDREFASVEARHFLSFLLARVRSLKGLCVGQNFRFGRGRKGDYLCLQEYGDEVGLSVDVVQSELFSNSPVSSSRIREALKFGQIEEVNEMLGWIYTISGEVLPGKGMGKEFGFPTINIPWIPQARPAYGVYVGMVHDDSGERNAKYAIANYGLRPTVEEGATQPLLEVHVLDSIVDGFGNVGQKLSMTLQSFLRPEKKFDSLDSLKSQIKEDLLRAEKMRQKA
ncbi:riboflavin biosynthesis protein RibF [Opitutales bacterium]|nr:riboflavin biosynthesis protein RibF [Opitutales bacterium]